MNALLPSALLALSALLLGAPLCEAQDLDAKERAWVASIAAVASSEVADLDIEKEAHSEGTDLFVGVGELRVVITRYSDPKSAFTAASQMALYSSGGDDPMFIEVRGKDVLAMGGDLAADDLTAELRAAAWRDYPWSGAKTTSRLLLLNLLDGGFVLRVNRPEGVAYAHLQALLERAKTDAADAVTNPDDAEGTFEVISSTELRMSQDDKTAHIKVTDKHGIHVIRGARPSKALVAFAEVVKLPIRAASTGASGALGGLGRN